MTQGLNVMCAGFFLHKTVIGKIINTYTLFCEKGSKNNIIILILIKNRNKN